MDDPVPHRPGAATSLAGAAAGLALACVAWAGVWQVYVKPRSEDARKRYETTMDLWRLYDLQLARKRSVGTYADGLDALLTATNEGPALRKRMAEHLDLDTLAVVGGADSFKLEANVLDGERTLLKVRGPIAGRPVVR